MSALDDVEASSRRRAAEVRQAREAKKKAETERADAERRARRDRVGRALAILIAVAALALGGWAIVDSRGNAADVAELAASGSVASARATSLDAVRGAPGRRCDPIAPSLFCVNEELAAAGLSRVPDPGPTANAYQLTGAVGEARGTLRTLRELRARGVALPGVTLPGPPGRFPRR